MEILNPWWYMGDYGHQVTVDYNEEDSFSIIAAANMFQAKACIFDQTFEELAPYLPWEFENYGNKDIYRLQNLVALMKAPEGDPVTTTTTVQQISTISVSSTTKVSSTTSITTIPNNVNLIQNGGFETGVVSPCQ